jgi:drug/metabolite transporter (DMT)-like permease
VSNDAHASEPHVRLKVIAAFAIIYFVWGSTFLATRLGVRDLPPLLFAAGRSFLASGLLFVLAVLTRERFPRTVREWRYMVLLGLLMITFSNGLTTTAIKHIPSNEAALLSSSLALWMAGLGAIGPKGHALTMRGTIGLLLGLAGVALLVWPRGTTPSGHLGWQFLVITGGFSWSVGTILFRSAQLPVGPMAFNSMIMLFGACGMLIGAVGRGELPLWHWEIRGLVAMLYLALFGSALAYTAYAWLVTRTPMDRVATFAYVNPAIATVLGWAVLGEALGPQQIAGTLVILLGVALVTMPSRVR